MKKRNVLSHEQTEIIESLKNNNVCVTGYTGTGKTTIAIYIANKEKNKKILYLSKYEYCINKIQEIIINKNLKNMESFTIWNFIEYLCNKKFETTIEIQNYIRNNENNINKKINYDYIIIDDVEDLDLINYELIWKIIFLNKKNVNICLIGDTNQSIDKFNCESRYIKFSEELFPNSKKWKKFILTKSYTITKNNIKIVDNILLDKNYKLKSNVKKNKNINYIVANIWNSKLLLEKIKIASVKHGIENIMILTPSIENKNLPINYIIEDIAKIGVIYSTKKDTNEVNYKLAKDKLLICTYQQSKNIVRKIVFILNFDKSYYENNSNNSKKYLENVLYIATTRSTHLLTFVQDFKNDNINNNFKKHVNLKIDKKCKREFIQKKMYDYNIQTQLKLKNAKKVDKKNAKKNVHNNTKLIYNDGLIFLDNIINSIPKLLTNELDKTIIIKEIHSNKNKNLFTNINWLNIIEEKKLISEKITQLNKEVILNNFYVSKNNNFNIIKELKNIYQKQKNYIINKRNELLLYENFINNYNDKIILNTILYLKLFTLWNYYISGDKNKLNNIFKSKFNWLPSSIIEESNKILENLIYEKSAFKMYVSKKNNDFLFNKTLIDYIDCVDLKNNTVWYFTLNNKLTIFDQYKLGIQSYLIKNNPDFLLNITKFSIDKKLESKNINYSEKLDNINFKYKILNINTNSVYEIDIDEKKIEEIIFVIFKSKQYQDEEKRIFITNNLDIKENIFK